MKKIERRARQVGFSVVELMIVVIIIFILSAFAVLQLRPALQQIQSNAALDQLKTALREGRELSVSQRRTIILQFLTAAPATSCPPTGGINLCIALTQMQVVPAVPPAPPTQVAAANPFEVLPLEGNVQFISFNGELDTPDAFIGAAPTVPNGIYTGSTAGVPGSGMQFHSDGTFTNGNGNPINLTIFLGEPNIPTTARAITILGNTGKVSWYQGTGGGWFRL
jgi:type II secretory pathway pseudopilin PulG